ncbi:MAG: META domain-containing protein [Leptotrichiaceae bacterium]|nr:META domain-containing protein [Leptotrichiaceae bacterium]
MKTKFFLSLISMFFLLSCAVTSSDTSKNGEGKEQNFTAVLLNTSWELTEISGKKINIPNTGLEKPSITLNFTDKGINGISAVNRYFSSYTIKGNTVSFGVIGSTKMGGPQEMMNLEIKYLGILEKSEKIEIPDNNTLILKSENEYLKFKKM